MNDLSPAALCLDAEVRERAITRRRTLEAELKLAEQDAGWFQHERARAQRDGAPRFLLDPLVRAAGAAVARARQLRKAMDRDDAQ